MNLSVSQIKERIKNPINKREIHEAFEFEERIRLHSVAYDKNPDWNYAFQNFMSWTRSLLTTEKYERFKELLASPIATTELTNEVFSNYLKIFESSNARRDYFFDSANSEEQKVEFMEFLGKYEMFWKTDAWHHFRNYICSFMVIDLPKESEEEKEYKPYLSFVHIKDVIDAEIDNRSKVYWLIYKVGEGEDIIYVYVDDKKYIVLNKNKQKINEVVHNFGETPSRQFWTSNVNDNWFKKKSPLSYLLGKYDYLLFHEVSKEFPELYAKFPIMSEYAEDETNQDYENSLLEETGNSSSRYYQYSFTEGGDLNSARYENRLKSDDKKNKSIGAGSIYQKSVPEEGQPDIGDPVAFISPDVTNLEYINENLRDRRAQIYTSATGAVPDFKNDQAKNEKQVQDQHESEKNILMEIKTNFELAEQWAVNWFGKIIYDDSYKGSVINYGTNFFLLTPSDIQNDIASFKEIGMPETMLLDKQNQFLETVYKTDSKALTRAKLLMELDPYPTMNIKEASELAAKNLIDGDMFQFKVQLPALIKNYERTMADIDGDLIVDGTDIDKIKEALLLMFNPKSEEDGGSTGEEAE